MKNTKQIINLIFSLSLIMLFYSCATNKVEKTKSPEPAAQEALTYPVPSSSLPKLVNDQELSFVPKQTKYEQIYVKLFLPERPEENLVDIYVYDKKAKKYICCIDNCYFDTVQEENFTGFGVFWSTWAKQNAYYLIDIDRYALIDKDGNEY